MNLLPTSAIYERAGQQLSGLRAQADSLQGQIASGSRLERSSDDPVAAARLRMLQRKQHLSEVFEANSSRAAGDLQMTDGALNGVAQVVIRARELAVQAANSTLSDRDRASVAQEITQLRQSLLSIANSANLDGHALFGGEASGTAYAQDAAGTITYVGTVNAARLDLDDGQDMPNGLTGPEVFSFGGAGTDLFAVLGKLASDLSGGAGDPAAAARGALGALDEGLEKVTTAQTVVGVRLGFLDFVGERRTTMSELETQEQARIGGSDIASTITRLQQVMTVLEASQASFVKLTSLSLFDRIT